MRKFLNENDFNQETVKVNRKAPTLGVVQYFFKQLAKTKLQ